MIISLPMDFLLLTIAWTVIAVGFVLEALFWYWVMT